MKEVFTKSFWEGVKKTFDEALKGPPPANTTLRVCHGISLDANHPGLRQPSNTRSTASRTASRAPKRSKPLINNSS